MPSKTIKQWLCELPQPYKKQALGNTSAEKKKLKRESLSSAIGYAFTWRHTAQGDDYWRIIQTKAARGLPISHL